MKKFFKSLLVLFAAAGLAGCSFADVKGKINSLIHKEESSEVQKEEQKPSEEKPSEEKPSGEEQKPEADPVLVSIAVSGQFKTEYEVGEEFSSEGIIVTAHFDKGEDKDVSSEVSFSGFNSSVAGECIVTVSFGGKSAEISLTIVEPEPQSVSISFADFEEVFAYYGLSVSIPDFVCADSSAVAESISQTVFCIKPSSYAEMLSFVEACELAGWVLEEDTYGDYSGTFGEMPVAEGAVYATIYIGDYTSIAAYAGIIIQFGLGEVPAAGFPSADIKADLESVGITDSLPEFSGEASGYSYYSQDGTRQLYFTVADEEAAITTYQADLIAAGYTEAGTDTYGDMHYTSPNSQLDVVAWRGSDIGYNGYIFVDIEVLN